MGEFRQANDSITSDALDEMINNLNSDQQRIFKNVTEKISQNTNVLRHSISGTGGTGKSFLLNTLKHWIAKNFKKSVAVTAPTGIAAFNING